MALLAQMGAACGWRSLALHDDAADAADAGSCPTFGMFTLDIRTINSASFIPFTVARIARQVCEMRVSMWPLGPAAESATAEALAAGSAHSTISSSMACGVATAAACGMNAATTLRSNEVELAPGWPGEERVDPDINDASSQEAP